MTTRTWLKSMIIRVIKTICETAIATIGTSTLISEVNWTLVLSSSLLSGFICFLTCLAGLPEVN